MAGGGLRGGSWWVAGWVSGWVWVAGSGGSHFLWIPVVLGVVFFAVLFYIAPNTKCRIFSKAFS